VFDAAARLARHNHAEVRDNRIQEKSGLRPSPLDPRPSAKYTSRPKSTGSF
jgi:hypothetical protein